MRYWVSWWSGYYADEGCTKPPVQVWISGQRDRANDDDRDDVSICAVVDAPNEDAIWAMVKRHFPDYEGRFCQEAEADWRPEPTRFPGFTGETTVTAGEGAGRG